MRAIDTNVLLRLLVRDDENQARHAESFVANGAWISHVVLAEAVWVLTSTYRHSRAQIAQAIELLLKHKSLAVQDAETVSAALTRFMALRRIEFPDCLIVEIAHRAGHTPLGTFNRDFAKLDGVQRLDRAND